MESDEDILYWIKREKRGKVENNDISKKRDKKRKNRLEIRVRVKI